MSKILNCSFIRGKEVSIEEAAIKAKKLVSSCKSMHVDGLGCDNKGLKSIFDFAETKTASVDHMDGEKIADLNNTIQRYGGFFSSLGEIYHRSELIFFIGFDKTHPKEFDVLKNSLKKPKIFFFDGNFKPYKEFKFLNIPRNKLVNTIKKIQEFIKSKKQTKEYKLNEIIELLRGSKYTSVIYSSTNNKELTNEIFRLIRLLNSENIKTSILSYTGTNNLGGAIQYSLWKTGYPLRIQFTENGPIYNPIEINSNYLSKKKDLQVFISCFDYERKPNMFKKNIFIGNPNHLKKQDYDIFIPAKVPGVNKSGIVHRGDGLSILKLKKKINTENLSVEEIIKLIS